MPKPKKPLSAGNQLKDLKEAQKRLRKEQEKKPYISQKSRGGK